MTISLFSTCKKRRYIMAILVSAIAATLITIPVGIGAWALSRFSPLPPAGVDILYAVVLPCVAVWFAVFVLVLVCRLARVYLVNE